MSITFGCSCRCHRELMYVCPHDCKSGCDLNKSKSIIEDAMNGKLKTRKYIGAIELPEEENQC